MLHTFDWGFIVGYKHFFSQNVGARIYGNLNLSHISLSDSVNIIYPSADMLINYTINADFLYNFYNNNNLQAGAFIGFGLGGISALQTIPKLRNTRLIFPNSINTFDMGLNIGLRANALDNHSVELAIYVPFLKISENNSQTYRHAFTMMARYVYSFDITKKQVKQATKRDSKYKNRRIKTQQSPKNIKQSNNDNSTNYDEYDIYYK